MDQAAIRSQLMQLRDLLMVVNPRLANYLGEIVIQGVKLQVVS